MKKAELLDRLSDVITFYSNENRGEAGETKEELKEIQKDIDACELIESFIRKNYK